MKRQPKISIFVDCRISVNGTATPYCFRRVDSEASDEFWLDEDAYFGTRFKKLQLPQEKYGRDAEDCAALQRDIYKAIVNDGWDLTPAVIEE